MNDPGLITHAVAGELCVERRRQVADEGYDNSHDDRSHPHGDIARAAASYCVTAQASANQAALNFAYSLWPWNPKLFKPKNPRQDLVRAGALIIAEIERIDRGSR